MSDLDTFFKEMIQDQENLLRIDPRDFLSFMKVSGQDPDSPFAQSLKIAFHAGELLGVARMMRQGFVILEMDPGSEGPVN